MLQGHYYRGYDKRFGFTPETMEAKIWPGKFEGQTLLKNLEKAIPGLTVCHNKAGEEVALPIQTQLIKKMSNDNRKRLTKLRRLNRCNSSIFRAKSKIGKVGNKKRKISDHTTEDLEDFNLRPSEYENGFTSKLSVSGEYLSGAEDEHFDFYTL